VAGNRAMQSIDPCPKCGGAKHHKGRIARLVFCGTRRRRLPPPEQLLFVK